MTKAILTLNAGSSSVKAAVFAIDGERRFGGQVKGMLTHPVLEVNLPVSEPQPAHAPNASEATRQLLDAIHRSNPDLEIVTVGHRVVHGGRHFSGPIHITPDAHKEISDLSPLAPGHQPLALEAIALTQEALPEALQVASFDTAFHRTQSDIARSYALPADLRQKGIERYGFHGLSYDYLAQQAATLNDGQPPARVVAAHLGNGCSLCAMRDGKSAATSMGFTALDGLPMGTRSGDIDPGVVLHLIRHEGMNPADVERLLYQRSGLLGLSDGESNDMATLLASNSDAATFAVSVFCYRVARGIADMTAAIGGLDALVFSGGIGEHAAPVRSRICEALEYLGVSIDERKNAQHAIDVSAESAGVKVWVIPTDEEAILFRDALHTLQQGTDVI